ncbi:uncharacterized protein SPAPADRAFT_60308 [Spathaspora passalidarum NRRL Y-27907]|uniref:5'-3' DNA helicase ZGRF1-like N-terminal domain-containing protein n=1 Tax=Spathaspora passalidarum (strain NRRL Y-27907 / 11-Y1) TaxID=619300 RepID=G3AKS5_SPAPN|nr:uncharacterized protein SPAPADRAFT_60308 [Spathaspora passalidarum NRRL Y-27907]EGW32979.1 hypothetical protein SPAPADRAFT_60308 [Spathaspora passalidarum NRRL Y-27907]
MTEEVSIVHEYQVLYSNRVRQKDKKWNDGKLQFYELNSKLQLFNSDNHLISTDFIRDRPISFILANVLVEDNEFAFPSNKYIIQIQDKMGVVERDISFKKRSQVKQEQGSPRPATISVKRRVSVKQEPVNKKDRIITRLQQVVVKAEPKPTPKPSSSKNLQVALANTDLNIRKRLPIRIPPKSSQWFAYINTPSDGTNATQNNKNKVTSEIKQEPVFDSGTSVEQANIIYDLSDFEEDARFADMLKRREQNKSSTKNTPSSENYNQAHEFDLSSQSDFADVDL